MNYLDINQVLAIHHEVIEQAGGSQGVRDLGLLDSAVAKASCQFWRGRSLFGYLLQGSGLSTFSYLQSFLY